MKYVVVLAVLVLGCWLWRQARANNRADDSQLPGAPHANKAGQPANRQTTPKLPTEIVACACCQVHLPRSEAVMASGHAYCSVAHSRQAGN